MWTNIKDPVWDERKNELFKLENPDSFNLPNLNIGDKLWGIWYQLLIDNVIVGYFFINDKEKEYEAEIVLSEKHKGNKYGSSALKLIENIVRKKGGDKITMANINAGKACGICHNDKKAFGTKDCTKCHKK